MPDATATLETHAVPVQPSLAIVIHPAEGGGFWVEVPAFPGVYAEGETVEEATSNASAVLTDYFQRRERARFEEVTASPPLTDDQGPIPVIAIPSDDLGVIMPVPAKVEAARHAAFERMDRAIALLPEDPQDTWEEFMKGMDSDRPRGHKLFEGMY